MPKRFAGHRTPEQTDIEFEALWMELDQLKRQFAALSQSVAGVSTQRVQALRAPVTEVSDADADLVGMMMDC